MSQPTQIRPIPQIAHVDVNCFYASAERAFNPSLEGPPAIVLSSDDGYAVTRSPGVSIASTVDQTPSIPFELTTKLADHSASWWNDRTISR